MFSRISKLSIICIMLIVIIAVHQVEAGTWTQKADMPTARYYAGSAVVDGKIYVIGGYDGQKALSAVEEYDPATDTWTRRADMPTPRWAHSATAVDGIIYAIGGWNTAGREVSIVEAYDPATDTWTKKADMPTRRARSVIAAVDGRIYVIGGLFGETAQDNRALSAVEAYDPATDTWTTKADMPEVRYDHAVCAIDGRIYVSGGEASYIDIPGPVPYGTSAAVQVYDPATDAWTQASDMPGPTSDHAACAVDGRMYIFGGTVWRGAFLSPVVSVYDPATDTWTTAADLPTPRWNLTADVVDGKIYAIGGRRGVAATAPVFSTVEEFDPGLPGAISSVRPAGKLLETWGQVKKVQ